jgi:hypothetical protein
MKRVKKFFFMLYSIVNAVLINMKRDLKKGITNYLKDQLVIHYQKSTCYKKLSLILVKLDSLHTLVIGITHSLLSRLFIKYPLVYNVLYVLQEEYFRLITGNIESRHVKLLFFAGFYCNSESYFYWLTLITLTVELKNSLKTNHMHKKHPKIYYTVLYTLDIVYYH